jgi:DNA-directed RNA polymerase subunit RPC12/RpoP
MFSEYSTQSKFWWICERGHYWQSTIAHRTAMGSNCPYCSNRRVLKGYNDFLTTNQNGELINEWSYSLNEANGIFPDSIVEGSKKKVWWICSMCGHEWSTTISSRKKGSSCPNCKKIKD